MKFRAERDSFSEAVAWAARTLPTRSNQPLLSGLMITAEASGLTLSSFDYEVSGRVSVEAVVDTPGRVLVPGRLLSDIARSLPAQPVTLQLEGSRVTLECGRSSFTLPTMSADDYPELPQMPTSAGVVAGASFAAAVAQVAVAASSDETISFLTGIRLEMSGSMITLAATDRYRLAVRELTWAPESLSIDAAALVPARVLADTAKTLAGHESVVIALAGSGQDEGLLGIHGGGRSTTTRLLGGEFPKYRTLLPAEANTIASVDTAALVEAVKRVSLVAERNTPLRMRFSGDEVDLQAGSGDEAQAVEALDATITGDDIEIAFNPRFLLDGLSALDAPVVRFAFTVSNKPAVLTGAAERGAEPAPEFRYLLMPVRLTG
ncbi:MAG: DNA polymerase III subunit beta [Actinobacteria bacterium]|uniref:Unannotated protein n=1 Tax=freshwater metagenome TaxID=449393 RepID=A0A6J7P528_9ZZZZ|nr:DNA polymerase III subunit beta [Actinomycetota bacterium]MSW42819.1 DNA polymerase III subunit beta [Actinomycetota bacterium]